MKSTRVKLSRCLAVGCMLAVMMASSAYGAPDPTSKISAVERLEGMVVMHGTELRGWSIALGEESGDVTLSVAGDGEGFIVFGKCMNK